MCFIYCRNALMSDLVQSESRSKTYFVQYPSRQTKNTNFAEVRGIYWKSRLCYKERIGILDQLYFWFCKFSWFFTKKNRNLNYCSKKKSERNGLEVYELFITCFHKFSILNFDEFFKRSPTQNCFEKVSICFILNVTFFNLLGTYFISDLEFNYCPPRFISFSAAFGMLCLVLQ